MKKKEKKILLLGLGVIAVITFLFGTTYAYWKFQKEQTNPNVIASKCFQLSFVEDSASTIQLMNAYPMTDEEGSQLTPYTFTLTNQCDNELSYQVNLDILQNATLKEQYVKTRINEGSISLVSDFTATDITVEGAKKAYQIEEGTISAKETKSFEVRLWLDGDISADNEETMNQEFYSKVSVVGSYQGYRGRYT